MTSEFSTTSGRASDGLTPCRVKEARGIKLCQHSSTLRGLEKFAEVIELLEPTEQDALRLQVERLSASLGVLEAQGGNLLGL